MLTRAIAACLIAIGMAQPVLPQTSPDIQRVLDRLQQLEEQNRQIVDEIRALRSDLLQRSELKPQETSETPVSSAPTLSERMDVQESRTAELAQSKVETSQRLPISLTGMLLFNAFSNGKFGGPGQYPTQASFNRGDATSGASFRQTVLGLKFNGPRLPGGGKVSGSIYMDFFAGSESPFNNILHLRIATIDLAWKNTTISVGQDKPLISPREPSSLAQVGVSPLTGAGNLWDWQPQVRIEQRFHLSENSGLTAQGAVYETAEFYPQTLPLVYAGTIERARPGYEGRLEFFSGTERRRFEIAPGFHFSTTHVAEVSIPSHIVSLDGLARPFPILEITGEYFNGRNVSVLGARGGFNLLPNDVGFPVHARGGWGQIALFPTPRLSLHIYAGEESDRARDLPDGTAQRNFVYAGNLMYKLAPNVIAALGGAGADAIPRIDRTIEQPL